MLSNKAKYGLKAMLFMAAQPPGQAVHGQQVAQHENIPKKFLDLILLELKKNGLITSRMGKTGGYLLARPAGAISLGQVVRILDGPLAPIGCVSRSAYQPCPDCDEATCRVRQVMGRVRDAIAEVLDNTTLTDAAAAGAIEAVLQYDI